MIIIRCNSRVDGKALASLWEGCVNMAKTGVILLPPFCELLNEVPDDPDVIIVGYKES